MKMGASFLANKRWGIALQRCEAPELSSASSRSPALSTPGIVPTAATAPGTGAETYGVFDLFEELYEQQPARDPVYRWRSSRDGTIALDLQLTPVATCWPVGNAEEPVVEVLVVDGYPSAVPVIPLGVDSMTKLFEGVSNLIIGESISIPDYGNVLEGFNAFRIWSKTQAIAPLGTTAVDLAGMMNIKNASTQPSEQRLDIKQGAELLIRVHGLDQCQDHLPGHTPKCD